MKNSPLFTQPAPFEIGVQRREAGRKFVLWLWTNRNKILNGQKGSLPKLPPGWYYEDATIPAIPSHSLGRFGYAPGLPPFARWILRQGTPPPPPPPLHPRPRICDFNDSYGWREYNDAELIAAGWDPAKFEPYNAPPAPNMGWRVLLIAVLLGLVFIVAGVCLYSAQPSPTGPAPNTVIEFRRI